MTLCAPCDRPYGTIPRFSVAIACGLLELGTEVMGRLARHTGAIAHRCSARGTGVKKPPGDMPAAGVAWITVTAGHLREDTRAAAGVLIPCAVNFFSAE